MIVKSGAMVRKHWRGQYPLEASFFLTFILILPVLMVALYLGVRWAGSPPYLETCAIIVLGCAWIWAWVGTFRAALAHRGSAVTHAIIMTLLIGNVLVVVGGYWFWTVVLPQALSGNNH